MLRKIDGGIYQQNRTDTLYYTTLHNREATDSCPIHFVQLKIARSYQSNTNLSICAKLVLLIQLNLKRIIVRGYDPTVLIGCKSQKFVYSAVSIG